MTGPGQSCTSSSRRRASTPLPPRRPVVRRFGCTGTSCTSRTQKGVWKKKPNLENIHVFGQHSSDSPGAVHAKQVHPSPCGPSNIERSGRHCHHRIAPCSGTVSAGRNECWLKASDCGSNHFGSRQLSAAILLGSNRLENPTREELRRLLRLGCVAHLTTNVRDLCCPTCRVPWPPQAVDRFTTACREHGHDVCAPQPTSGNSRLLRRAGARTT